MGLMENAYESSMKSVSTHFFHVVNKCTLTEGNVYNLLMHIIVHSTEYNDLLIQLM